MAGHVPDHSAVACEVLAGNSVNDAVVLAGRTASVTTPEDDTVPTYEHWRNRIRAELSAISDDQRKAS